MYSLRDVHKVIDNLEVLKCINIDIPEHKVVSILGPSGCGKTTLLNIISKIIEPDKGAISGFENKKTSYLFQDLRLLKWKTVYENIEFVLKDHLPKNKIKETIEDYLKQVELIDYKNYYPHQLSGGMKQRVALARAFAYPAEILLMDEPFKSLDFELKYNLINNFKKLWAKDKRTVIFVTHDVQSAIMLGDYIYLLSQKPTIIAQKYKNNLLFNERNFQNKEFSQMERTIYLDLMNKAHSNK